MNKQYTLALKFSDEQEVDLLEVSELLYDLNSAYEFAVFAGYSDYKGDIYDLHEDSMVLSRRRYRRYVSDFIKSEYRLKVLTIRKQSPLVIEVVVPLVGCAWVLMQIFQKVKNWPLERRKLELEVSKLEWDENERRRRISDEYVKQLSERPELVLVQDEIVHQFSENQFQLKDVSIKPYRKIG